MEKIYRTKECDRSLPWNNKYQILGRSDVINVAEIAGPLLEVRAAGSISGRALGRTLGKRLDGALTLEAVNLTQAKVGRRVSRGGAGAGGDGALQRDDRGVRAAAPRVAAWNCFVRCLARLLRRRARAATRTPLDACRRGARAPGLRLVCCPNGTSSPLRLQMVHVCGCCGAPEASQRA